jgi:hypothetical protein
LPEVQNSAALVNQEETAQTQLIQELLAGEYDHHADIKGCNQRKKKENSYSIRLIS